MPSITFAYDAKSRRIRKTMPSATHTYSHDSSYTYDAFGRTLSFTGPLAYTFPHHFSTKYFDPETGLYYYGYRYYSPTLMRWLNRDPIEEDGGMNLYAFCANCSSCRIDIHGKNIYLYTGNSSGNEINDLFHQAVAVDVWSDDCPPRLIGRESFSFGTDFQEGNANSRSNWLGNDSIVIPGNTYIGRIYKPAEIVGMMERRKRTTVQEDRDWLEAMNRRVGEEAVYSVLRHNCRLFSQIEFEKAPGKEE